MSIEIFIERSRMGKVIYLLRGDSLSISGRWGFQKVKVEVELHAMSQRAEKLSCRFWRPILYGFGFGIPCLSITIGFLVQKALPVEAVIYPAGVAGMIGAAFLGTGILWIPRLEIARFKDVVGRTIFDVIRERRTLLETDAFVDQLQQSIVRSKEPNQSPDPTFSSGTPGAGHQSRHP